MISILCPTRQRPNPLRQMVESANRTASGAFEIVCYVDDDDASYDGWHYEFVQFVRGPRIVLSNMWNKCAEHANPNADIFMQGNDDILFRTPNWNEMVEKEFAAVPDKILVVHGADGTAGDSGTVGRFGVHPFVSRRWFEVLGYVTAPYFSSDYGDTWINDLANALGRRKALPFLVEHIHFWFGKCEMDDNTRARLARHSADCVEQLYRDLEPLRQVDIEKLRKAVHD